MEANILRKKFLDFFKAKRHKIVESDSLIPKDDPTVLFTPAGMNQFKRECLGFNVGFKRAATAQRCLRTDDLDKVGKTSGHHTFFEMLGNFSFGDYFKKEAIRWAWEFLTEELKIDQQKLSVSVYQDDEEAYSIWKDVIKVPEDKIRRLGDKENFWPSQAKQKGPNGPCGPCSEIFYEEGGNSVEVWNLVFTQFNRKTGGKLEPLPKKNIDTGMGLERLAAVMQGVPNNFETDLFRPIVKEVVAGCRLSSASLRKDLLYAIADHGRAVTFAIYDGVLPSNEGRGYVIRKIIRKSLMHLRELGINEPFLYKLVPVVSEIMKEPYPELDGRRENISEIILSEEKNFISTLKSSDTLFEEKFSEVIKKHNPQEAGKIAFQLYDTYGIPFDLTKEWLSRQDVPVSIEAFENELKKQRQRSKSLSAMKGEVFGERKVDFKVKQTSFVGYENFSVNAKLLKIIKDNTEIRQINEGEEAAII
ncbi:MAG: alanine--tRNA ligase, partial [Candidatus Omnitrophica bacterium]|nr:alanine--tRNA ligase [Candidatus Omnitrophota bacterium]